MSIDGGVILITGASSGIGRELALQMAERAEVIILVARREERLLELQKELVKCNEKLVVDVQKCDLTSQEQTSKMCGIVQERYVTVDVLINNAGLGDIGIFSEASWEKQQRIIEVNTIALTYLCRRFLPLMLLKNKGAILNVSSGFGLTWMPFVSTYVATKHYVTAFTECLRAECAGTGVLVSQLCPGPVTTEFEEVAESPIQTDLVEYVAISAEKCAREAIRGLDKGKALIQPGWIGSFSIWMGRLSPRWVQRIFYSTLARQFRQNMRRSE